MAVVLLCILILLYLVQLYFVKSYFIPLSTYKDSTAFKDIPVSVIICAKNEADNLKRYLPLICNQDYFDFEVLIMDDHSTDETKFVVQALQKSFKNLTYVKASEGIKSNPGKKWALAEARKLAKYDHFLLTDADCMPVSNQWIRKMTSSFDDNKKIVLGIGQYHVRSGFTNSLVQYETLFTAISYLSFALKGFPYMGVGRNLAYNRSVLTDSEIIQENLASGDDDISLQPFLKSNNVCLCLDVDSQTLSESPKSFFEWVNQKQRHYSTANYYPDGIKYKLLILKSCIYLPNYIIISALILGFDSTYLLLLFFIRLLVWWGLWDRIRRHFSFQTRIYLLPCFEIFFSVFDIWIMVKNLGKNQNQW